MSTTILKLEIFLEVDDRVPHNQVAQGLNDRLRGVSNPLVKLFGFSRQSILSKLTQSKR